MQLEEDISRPQRFSNERGLTHHSGRSAVSRSLPAWPLRDASFSGDSGGRTLAAYLRPMIAEFGQGVLNEHGLAQVGFGMCTLLSFTSPFQHGVCSVSDLV